MKTMRAVLMVAVVGVVSAALFGCSLLETTDEGASADQLYTQGVAYIQESMDGVDPEVPPWEWDMDMEEAYRYFDDALAEDPDHCGALLMAAVMRLAMLLQDPELAMLLDDLFPDDGRSTAGPGAFVFRAFQKPDIYALRKYLDGSNRDDFHLSELQDFIEGEVLPALGYADGNLEAFEDNDCFVLIPVEMEIEREAMELELDATDAYLIHAAVDVMQAVFYIAVSYNVDIDEGQTWEELLDYDPDFLSVRPGNHMPSAYSELLEAAGHLSDSAWSLATETDPQDTDFITESDTEGWLPMGEGASDTLAMLAAAFYDALTGGITFNPYEDTGEPGAPDIDVLVDLEEFFTDPLDPISDYLPAHTWPDPDTMDVVLPLDFPDPTFSDGTPGMTDGDWGDILDWLGIVVGP